MNNLFEKSCEKAQKTVHLSAVEKSTIRAEISKYLELNPVSKGFFSKFAWVSHPLKLVTKPIPVFALILALGMGIGTTYASESALPGDVLYPVKLNVNERFRGFIVFTDESRAQLEFDLANRRLEEAKLLALRGGFNPVARAQVAENFTQFSQRAHDRIERLKTVGNVVAAQAVSSSFENALRAHEEALAAIKENGHEDEKKEMESLIIVVKKEMDHTHSVVQTIEITRNGSVQAPIEIKVFRQEKGNIRDGKKLENVQGNALENDQGKNKGQEQRQDHGKDQNKNNR